MLNFNLKKKILAIVNSYSPPEINPQTLSDIGVGINSIISNSNLTITIEIFEQNNIDWKKVSLELENKLLTLRQINKANIIINFHKKAPQKKLPKLILICSAKGGVGKSTICVNLAIAFNILGKKSAIVDADIYGPSTAHLLGISNKEPQIKNNIMIPLQKHGVKLNSMGLIMPKNRALIWRGPMLSKSLNNLLNATDWGDSEYIFIDLPPGTGDVYLTLLKNYPSTNAILISSPQQISLIDVIRSLDMLHKLDVNIAGIIENMAFDSNNLMSKNVPNFATKNKLDYLGKILYDQQISYYCDAAKPVILQKNLDISKNLLMIAKNLLKTERNI